MHDFVIREPIENPNVLQAFGIHRPLYRALGQLGHNGIDFAAPEGTPVMAAAAGTVVHAGWSHQHPWLTHNAGIAVLVHHGTHYTGYAHLSGLAVAEGQRVETGDVLGAVGRTGTAGSDHLHFEVLAAPPVFSNGYAGRIRPVFTIAPAPAVDTGTEAGGDPA